MAPANGPGLQLLVEFRAGHGRNPGVKVLRAGSLPYCPRFVSVVPRLTRENLAHGLLAPGEAEVVLEILDGRGAVIRACAWPAGGAGHGDGKRGHLRILRIPWPDGAALLRFSHRRVVGEAGRCELAEPFVEGTYGVSQSQDDDAGGGAAELPLGQPLAFPGEPWPLDGRIEEVRSEPWRGRFNIVVTGDGFRTKDDLHRFARFAARLRAGFADLEPFRRLHDRLQWHLVVARSNRAVGRDGGSFLAIRDEYRRGKAGFFGADDPRRVLFAACQAVPAESLDLIVVLVNSTRFGGHAWPDTRMAFVPLYDDGRAPFARLAAHECGHVVSRLADEKPWGDEGEPIERDPYSPDPNQAALDEALASVASRLTRKGVEVLPAAVPSDRVWWKGLAAPEEIRRGRAREFEHVRVSGDPEEANLEDAGRVGLFWGCQDSVNAERLWKTYYQLMPAGDRLHEASLRQLYERRLGLTVGGRPTQRSAGYYFRPSGTCLMREYGSAFCRVCEHLLANSINEVARPADLAGPFPPGW